MRPPPLSTCLALQLTTKTRQDSENFRNATRNEIVEMHARTFLMQIEWIAVFTMYFASTNSIAALLLNHSSQFFAVSLIFPRASASYRWIAHLVALLALPVVSLKSRSFLPPSVSYCQVSASLTTLISAFFSNDQTQIFLMFVSYLDARMNSSFMRFSHRALCICAMLYLMLRRIIGT